MYLKHFCFLLAIILISCKNETDTQGETAPSIITKETVRLFDNPTAEHSQLPRLFSNGNDLYLSWVTAKDSLDILNYSVLKEGNWAPVTEVISGSDWFTNWADFPAIAENNGRILTSFLQKSAEGTYTYDVKLNLYTPPSAEATEGTWKKNFILHTDGTQSEHGFVSIRPYVANSFFITWLDGRETVGKEHGGGSMTLRKAIVFEDGSIDYDDLLDARICDCCQTAAAVGPNNELIVAYRDRSESEIRDISVVRWNMEAGWSKPMTIGNDQWKIAGCPVNGPAMDAFGSNVALAWFTAAQGSGVVNVAFSIDSGSSFGDGIRLDAGNATGRVDVVMLNEQEAAMVWMEPRGADEVIVLRKINNEGVAGRPIMISTTSAERASGFPQLERVGDTLYLAWTVIDTAAPPRVQTATVALSDL